MTSALDKRKKNISGQISKAHIELEALFPNAHDFLSFTNERRDSLKIRDYLGKLEKKPDLINKVNTVNMSLIHSPYNQARMGKRDDYAILELLKERLELAELRIDAIIAEITPLGKDNKKVILAKYDYCLRLLRERELLKWSKNR